MMLLLLLWTLLTVASAIGLLLFLAFDEWQVEQRSTTTETSFAMAAHAPQGQPMPQAA